MILIVMAAAMALFISNKLRIDLISMGVLTSLLLLGLLQPDQALFGFASLATGIVAAMFVLSAGLVRTGLIDWIARYMDKLSGKGRTRLILVLSFTVIPLSAFIVNTAIVAIFIPVVISLAKQRKLAPSQVLIPISFASQFGGACTLIGTSTNILVHTIAIDSGYPGFKLFEFAPLGLVVSAVGVIYLVVFSGILLPKRKEKLLEEDLYRLSDYLTELLVEENSPLIGQKWNKLSTDQKKDIRLMNFIRDKKNVSNPVATMIRENDILLLSGDADKLFKFKDSCKLKMRSEPKKDKKKANSADLKLVETLVPPRSYLEGRTLGHSDFRRRFGCTVLAIQRRGKIMRERLDKIRLDSGDTLLLRCDSKDLNRVMRSSDLIAANELTELQLRKDRAIMALSIIFLVVILAALEIIPILTAALAGALGMILSGCITPEEAYQAIDWKVIFLLGGILPLGLALQQTGTAEILASTFLKPLTSFGPYALLAGLYLLTAVLTETMSNTASAILLAPVALSAAGNLGVNPIPFLVAITFAASTSFSTPIGYQTNTMIYAPGGYRFFDFTRIGLPLNLIIGAISIWLIPILWPF
ncbi:MAG: SLC13 family permease [Candidatus Aminicenantes bacterium]|nr:SLC13 family permease [Candidatus Aminicenantes bacterium]